MGLLDGELAGIISDALVGAGVSRPVVLTKVTPGPRIPGARSQGTTPTTRMYTAQGLMVQLSTFTATQTLIKDARYVIALWGASIAGGAVPEPGDQITIEGATHTIASEAGAVDRDPASAVYTCQCR